MFVSIGKLTVCELEKGPVEIVDLPINIMVIFHSFFVRLPEGTAWYAVWFVSKMMSGRFFSDNHRSAFNVAGTRRRVWGQVPPIGLCAVPLTSSLIHVFFLWPL